MSVDLEARVRLSSWNQGSEQHVRGGIDGLNRYLLEPASALTHLAGALAALFGLVILISLAWPERLKAISLAVYGLSLVMLFATSALFHGAKLPEERRLLLNRLDHVAIFLLIAGTYTPIILILFPAAWRWPTLALVWLVALGGITYKLFSNQIHGFFNATVYPIISWAGVLPAVVAYRIRPLAPAAGLGLLLLGGLIFMVGFAIYYFRRPDPWPKVFGHHEIWHLCVLGGSFCHFLFMLLYVVPHAP